MEPAQELFPRHAWRAVNAALHDTRVVVINGARQAGKSTLARLVMSEYPGSELRYLDEAPLRDAAQADPGLFVRHDGLLVIDEVQRVPDLFLAIKHEVDIDPRPGRFLLTGSARLAGLRAIPDLLPGRSETIELSPLSQGEIDNRPDGFIDAVLEHGSGIRVPPSTLRRDDYVERALRGGYPEAVRRDDPGRRARFFESYISDVINRDVRQLAEIERARDMRRLINLIAASTGTLANPASMANRLQVPATTVKRYLDLLDLVFITRRIPAWSSNLVTRAVATPKLLLNDSGLAAHLTGMSLKKARHPTAPVGPLLETFVLGELTRQLTFANQPVRLYHYRDRDQYEVDAVLESASGQIVACEVKAGETVRSEDFRGIERLGRRLGDKLVAGIVLYAGHSPLAFGDRLRAWPMSALWTLSPEARTLQG
ncbi:MAG TPA: ATP-binding protein [Streptosporangiaceae bacterium]|nr:ATP-binding protein [Streptosporangiaceae bacterium]